MPPATSILRSSLRPSINSARQATAFTQRAHTPAISHLQATSVAYVRAMSTELRKIKVKNPVVELDGDEMTRIIWKDIKDKVNSIRELDVQISNRSLLVHFPVSVTARTATATAASIARPRANCSARYLDIDLKYYDLVRRPTIAAQVAQSCYWS